MGTNYQNTKEKTEHTNVYYEDNEGNLHIIRADTLDALEARASVADLLDSMTVSKDNWKKPVLALIEGGKYDEWS